MEDKSLPQSVGEISSEPIYFPRKDEVCKRLDEFYKSSGVQKDILPSSLFEGALYAMRRGYRDNNPDWMAQVAHSLREILYQFRTVNKKWVIELNRYGSTYDKKKRTEDIARYYNLITNIAHHNLKEAKKSPIIGGSKNNPVDVTPDIFEKIVFQFGDIIFAVLRKQIDAHNEIDKILKTTPDKNSIRYIKELIDLNPDTHQYFYYKADERWLDWLWKNGFLDAIKQKAEDPTRYEYRTPEINYLVRIAEKAPAKVAEIMNNDEVATTEEKFNPEVIDQFLRICSSLPVKELAKIIPKIKKDGWVKLMAGFNQWGFEYEKMFETLAEARNYESIITLAEAVLSVKTKEEIEKEQIHSFLDNPFYFNDLSDIKVFEYLTKVEYRYVEQVFALVTKIMAQIVNLNREKGEDEVFKVDDASLLIDVDFLELQLGEARLSYRDNIRDLAAVITVLARRLIEKKCGQDNREYIHRIFNEYIGNFDDESPALPDSQSMWRLRLFVLSLCPQVFKNELKKSFFRLFKVEHYHKVISGAEYKKALRNGFSVLLDNDKRQYIKKVIEYFKKKEQEQESETENWHLQYGSQILSMIPANEISEEEKQLAKKEGFRIDYNYKPGPSIGQIRSGFVSPQGPILPEEFNELSIVDIAQKLRNEWSPEKLRQKYENDDFLRPRNAEGAAKLLKNDIPKRFQDYINNAKLFFERKKLNPHYSYSFLQGIQACIRKNKVDFRGVNWGDLLTLLISIKNSGKNEPFRDEKRGHNTFDAWLADWTAVHSAMTNVIQELLNEKNDVIIDFSKYRDQLFEIISYLLKFPDPTPEDERIETAKSKTKSPGDSDYMVSDPYTIAINTVRGRAFEALVLFVYQDGKSFAKNEDVKINSDVKKLYENVLKTENTRALMFMFGHYLPSFYFRDKEWVHGLLPKIFPQEPEKQNLYTSAWEGYLANNLYKEMFFDSDIQELYERGLNLKEAEYPQQKHFRDPDEGIAIHFALAFIYYYKDFGFEHKLFKKFWEDKNVKRHTNFVSFLGRSFVSGDNAKADELLEKEPESKRNLKRFWDWMLKNYKNMEPFKEFGFWINLGKDVFEPIWLARHVKNTLEKTKGILRWDYGLVKSIIQLAKDAPSDTLVIARLYLLEGRVRSGNIHAPFYIEGEWFKALQELYNNPVTKEDTKKLIDNLIREGGSSFWKLKEILNND